MPYNERSSHESNEGWISRDYEKDDDGEFEGEEDVFEDADLFKIIIEYTDEEGTVHYISTNIFEDLGEAEDAATALASEYGLEISNVTTITRAYYH